MRDVAVERAAIGIAQRAKAGRKGNIGETGRGDEVRMVEPIEAQHDLAALLSRCGVHADPVDAMLYIGRVGGLAHFSVADDVDARRHLLCHDLGHRGVGLGFERCGVDRAALFLGQDHVEQRFWAGQAADMRGEYSLSAQFHRCLLASLTPSPAARRLQSYPLFVIMLTNRRLVDTPPKPHG